MLRNSMNAAICGAKSASLRESKFLYLVCLVAVGLLTTVSVAHAGYESDKNNNNIGIIERALDKFKPNTAIYNGKAITTGASADDVMANYASCIQAIKQWDKYEKQITAKGRTTERFKKLFGRLKERYSYCAEMHKVAKPYVVKLVEGQKDAAAARVAAKATCEAVSVEARKAVGISDLYEILDTSAGSKTPATAEHVKVFRTKIENLVPVCSQDRFKDVIKNCRGQGIMLSPATNTRFDYSDICAPMVDLKKTLQGVVMRLLNNSIRHGSRDLPTIESFRKGEGWIHDTDAVYYKNYFQVTDEKKKTAAKEIKEAFDAAGIAPPDDMSVVWTNQQKYLDALKAAADGTAAEWKVTQDKCQGYACNIAKESIGKVYKGASIKAVRGRDWRIAKNSLGIPTHRYQGIWVVFKIKGENHCQARSMTAYEPYKGGSNYQKAEKVEWGYARFQKCR